MAGCLPVSVSVKIEVINRLKRESLFFKSCRIYRYPLHWPISPVAWTGRSAGRAVTMMEGCEMQAYDSDVQDRILGLVRVILKQNAIAAEVLPESKLVDVGLTSMDMVNLMLSVEAEFDFTIPQAEITPENFQSVKTLERMIVLQLKAAKAA
jgi:acyl carrier protein